MQNAHDFVYLVVVLPIFVLILFDKVAPACACLRPPRCGCCPTLTLWKESTRLGSEISLEDEPFGPQLSPEDGMTMMRLIMVMVMVMNGGFLNKTFVTSIWEFMGLCTLSTCQKASDGIEHILRTVPAPAGPPSLLPLAPK